MSTHFKRILPNNFIQCYHTQKERQRKRVVDESNEKLHKLSATSTKLHKNKPQQQTMIT